MQHEELLSLVLCLALLLSLTGCGQGEQDKKFDELAAKSPAASSEVSQEESAVSQAASREVSSEPVSEPEEEFEESLDDYERYTQKLEWGQLFELEQNTELSGTLTIGVNSSKTLEPWIQAFQAVYPNVEIKTKVTPVSADTLSKLIVDLNSGEAGDILYLGGLSLFKYAKSGLFLDLYPFIDADADIQREDFYGNVLKALETPDGKLCTISPGISIRTVYFNSLVTDQLGIDLLEEYPDGMDYKDIVGLYQQCLDEGFLDADAPLCPMGSKDYLGGVELMAYLDEAAGESSFTDPGYITFLETMNSIPAGVDLYCDGYATDYPFEDTSGFMMLGTAYLYQMDRYWKADKRTHNTPWLPADPTDGKKPFEAVLPLGITTACQNQELAWEFIKFMLTEKPFPEKPAEGYTDIAYNNLYQGCVPINRKNFEGLFRAYFDDEELFAYIDQLYSQRDVVRFQDGVLNSVWSDIVEDFYGHGLISAEDCAQQLQERTWIYMNE